MSRRRVPAGPAAVTLARPTVKRAGSKRGITHHRAAMGAARALAFAACLLGAFVAPGRAQQPADRDDRDTFVRVEGTRFVVGERDFPFLGANVAVMHGLAHRAALGAVLDAVRDDGLRVVRVWALGEADAGAPAWARDYAFRVGEDGWVATSFAHLDRVLAEARARELRVVVVLANRWADYGGIPRYLRWAGQLAPDDPRREPTELELAGFYDCARCDALYRAHVERVVGRVNALTGVPYRDDATIAAWELANELTAHPRDRAALVRWVAETARFVRALDANHLVAAGHLGYARASDRATWLAVQQLPEIDYADAHAYPLRSGRVRTRADLARFVDDRAQHALFVARKPLVFGEVGFSSSRRGRPGGTRAAWFESFLARCHRDGVAGALVWHYAPHDPRAREHAIAPDVPGDAATRAVRRVLTQASARWTRTPPTPRNARLGVEHGDAPIARLDRVLRVRAAPSRAWRTLEMNERALAIDPLAPAYARFEEVGVWREAPGPHAWGAGGGEVVYRFASPRGSRIPARLVIGLRASSELPGPGAGARASDIARIEVAVNGVVLGVLDAPPDDGRGAWLTLEVRDTALLARAFAPRARAHALRLRVDPDVGAAGLCLYASGAEGDASAGIRLVWTP
jgi:mannan endo-1,4-beta-mannosidase